MKLMLNININEGELSPFDFPVLVEGAHSASIKDTCSKNHFEIHLSLRQEFSIFLCNVMIFINWMSEYLVFLLKLEEMSVSFPSLFLL